MTQLKVLNIYGEFFFYELIVLSIDQTATVLDEKTFIYFNTK